MKQHTMSQVKFAIPKGSLEEATFKLLEKSWTKVNRKSRTYRVFLDDPNIIVKMLRPQEIPTLVYEGLYDVGITGKDWVGETNSDVEPILDLEYGKIRLVIAFPDKYSYKNLDSMIADYAKKKKILRISSEYLTTASKFIKELKSYKKHYGNKDPMIVTPWLRLGTNKNVQIHLSFGATEAKPPEDVDAIMDVTETGTTLKQNKLKIVDEVLTSSAHLIVNKKSLKDPKKREKIYDIVTLMRGAVHGRKYLHIYLNVEEKNLKNLLKQMPSLKRPTVSPLSEEGWFGVNTVIKKEEFHKLIPKMRKIAQGLVVHEPRQILELEEIKRDEEN
jgi:ATP phosphoribosyltransferase